jgi:hypothetical protein
LIVNQTQDSMHLVNISDLKSLDLAFNQPQGSVSLANMSSSKSLGFADSQAQKNMGLANISHPKHLDRPLLSFKTMYLILNDPLIEGMINYYVSPSKIIIHIDVMIFLY